jgi:hypothetical protein
MGESTFIDLAASIENFENSYLGSSWVNIILNFSISREGIENQFELT